MVDLDHVDPEAMAATLALIRADRHTFFCQTTNSQQGIRILFRYQPAPEWVDPTTPDEMMQFYRKAWSVGNDHYARLTGYEPDRSCKDAVRASFFCHDAEAYLCEEAVPLIIDATSAALPQNDSPSPAVNLMLITQLAKQHAYQPSGRHQFWVKLGTRLRYLGIERQQMPDYQQAAIDWLQRQGLLLADDPSLRKPREVEDAMAWGYDQGHEVEPCTEPEVTMPPYGAAIGTSSRQNSSPLPYCSMPCISPQRWR